MDKDIATVSECSVSGPEGRNGANVVARSGFLMLRNSAKTRAFLDTWSSSFELYEEIENPEQSALEALQTSAEWSQHIHLHDWSSLHSYDTCDRGFKSFSMHFPGHGKLTRVAQAFLLLSMSGKPEWEWAKNPALRDHAAAIVRRAVETYKVESPAPNGAEPFEPTVDQVNEVRQCLDKSLAAGYEGVKGDYDFGYARYIHYYLLASFRHNLPTFIFFTVPDKSKIPETIKGNIDSWRTLNPHHTIVIHDDADTNELARLLFPRLYSRWDKLLPVQRADLYRYMATAIFGGIYGDADTVCRAPISQWKVHSDDTFVAGVEAQNVNVGEGGKHEGSRVVQLTQYVFGAASLQPLVLDLLETAPRKIEGAVVEKERDTSVVGRLRSVLTSTGEFLRVKVAKPTPSSF